MDRPAGQSKNVLRVLRTEPISGLRSAISPAQVMVVAGAGSIVAGGLVAAVTRPLDFDKGSWLAAYLVLVCGVSSYLMGAVREQSPTSMAGIQLACWVLGNAAVIVGSLSSVPVLVDVAVLPLAIALVLCWIGTRTGVTVARSAVWAYRCWLVVLGVTVPIGAVLVHLRAG